MSTFIIAEAGINHNGNIDTAYNLVDVAHNAGADAVKFQTFWGLTNHPTLTDEELHDLELTKPEWRQLKDYCDRVGIEFMSTPDTVEAVDFLAEIGMNTWKIGSGGLLNPDLLRAIGRQNGLKIMSTGMTDIAQCQKALDILEKTLEKTGDEGDIVLLHCVSEYPTELENINLLVIMTLYEHWFGQIEIGLSDHTEGIEVPIAAVALGASVIEKHFTLDRSMKGPDHSWALDPEELKEMVRCIRNIEKAMGDGIKKPTLQELKLKEGLGKCL